MNPQWQVPKFSTEFCRAKATDYALVIPVLNEGDRIRRQMEKMRAYTSLVDSFIVDGGSTDGALDQGYLKERGLCGLLTLREPGGLSSQLRIGLAHTVQAGYQGAILIDGNDKDGVEAIPLFIDALKTGFDHVQGSRFVPGGRATRNPWKRLVGIKFIHAPLISLAAGYRYTDTTNGFRAYSRKFLTDPRVQPFRDVFSRYELHYYLAIRAPRLGFRVTEIPVERVYPATGKTPTKIRGLRGESLILKTLLQACLQQYNPTEETRT